MEHSDHLFFIFPIWLRMKNGFVAYFSDTHDKLKCRRCVSNIEVKPPPEDSDCNSDMSLWYHASSKKGLVDYELKQIWDAGLTFVFHHKSHDQIKVV